MKLPAEEAIAQIYAAHARALLLYARQWVGDAAAEDVVQRVFLRLLASGRMPAEPRTWLFRCVRNEAISASRADRRRDRRERSMASDAASWFVPRPEDRIDANIAQDVLQALPSIQREVVTLRIWSGLTLAEIAAITDMAISSVHNHYRAALDAMRKRLEPSCKTLNL
jgi:RNA polymerase sigma-70 factor (ECF subfamily)